MNKPLLIGYHTSDDRFFCNSPEFYQPAQTGGGVDFILCHFDPSGVSVSEECERVKKTVKVIKNLGAEAIINFEHQNFVYSYTSSDGHDWANHSDGTHRLNLPECFKEAMASEGNLYGVMYDELEHVIINRNLSITLASKFKIDVPVFPVSDSSDVIEQGKLLDNQLKDYADKMKTGGVNTLSGEHVFPVMFHTFAKNGIIPNFKSQKESFSNVQFAVAAGAALQYKTPLFNCIDMWYRMTFPGHSASELEANLKFAYLAGVDRVYVESSKVFFKDKEAGKYNDIGEVFSRFTKEYRGRERDYNVQDYKPEIGIIRFEDTFWGQGSTPLPWRNMLFGNPKIKVGKPAREWIQAFNIITHGETGNGGICSDRIEPRSLLPHRSFASMNGTAVFDENVTEEALSSLKLCFLCGYAISENTMTAVRKLVRENGLTVVTPSRFAPFKKTRKGMYEVSDGKGTWIVTDNLKSAKLRKRLAPFLGNKGEMKYRFGDKTLHMKITDNGNSFEVI